MYRSVLIGKEVAVIAEHITKVEKVGTEELGIVMHLTGGHVHNVKCTSQEEQQKKFNDIIGEIRSFYGSRYPKPE